MVDSETSSSEEKVVKPKKPKKPVVDSDDVTSASEETPTKE